MGNIINYKPTKLSAILGDLDQYKYNPTGIKTVVLDRLSDMLNGDIDIVEPSNPFIYLLEASCLNATFACQEYATLTKKLYPRLANTEDDLYLHMSDYDYLGRFATPSTANVDFKFLYADFVNNAIFDTVGDTKVIKIPRIYTVTVDKYTFTLLYPIIITMHNVSGAHPVIDVKYDTSVPTYLQKLPVYVIPSQLIRQNVSDVWICFTVPMLEVNINSTEVPIEKSKLFNQTVSIPPNTQFYFAEIHYSLNNVWHPMLVTYTDEVYDLGTPTACLKVTQSTNTVSIYIPPVYTINGVMGTKIRIDVYTTNGPIDVNFGDYNVTDFQCTYNPVDKVRDQDVYTAPIELLNKIVTIPQRIVGGNGGVNFVDLKASVINNSIGDRKLPITLNQITYDASLSGFTLIPGPDILTKRIFYLQTEVPPPVVNYPISSLNMDMSAFKFVINDTTSQYSVIKQALNNSQNNRYIISKGTVFKSINSIISILGSTEFNALANLASTDLTAELNINKYLSTFYHYVLDNGNLFPELRAYDLDETKLITVNYVDASKTGVLGLNTTSANFYKSANGYTLDILTAVTQGPTVIQTSSMYAYLMYTSATGDVYIFNQSQTTLGSTPMTDMTSSSQAHFRISLKSDGDIDSKDSLALISGLSNTNQFGYWSKLGATINALSPVSSINVNLKDSFQLVYAYGNRTEHINTFLSSNIDDILEKTLFNTAYVSSIETFELSFGDRLAYLNTNVRNAVGDPVYEVYGDNVLNTYPYDVYGDSGSATLLESVDDGVSCNLSTNILHHAGDIVYGPDPVTGLSVPQYKHRSTDPRLDDYGRPMLDRSINADSYLTLLFADYKSMSANDKAYTTYINYARSTLTQKILGDAANLQSSLLENTVGYLTIPNTVNTINVSVNGGVTTNIDPNVNFIVNVYVTNKVYDDTVIRTSIEYTIIKTISNYLNNTVLIKTELNNILYNLLKAFVVSVTIPDMAIAGADHIKILDLNHKLSINKLLSYVNEYYTVSEDVSILYTVVD